MQYHAQCIDGSNQGDIYVTNPEAEGRRRQSRDISTYTTAWLQCALDEYDPTQKGVYV